MSLEFERSTRRAVESHQSQRERDGARDGAREREREREKKKKRKKKRKKKIRRRRSEEEEEEEEHQEENILLDVKNMLLFYFTFTLSPYDKKKATRARI